MGNCVRPASSSWDVESWTGEEDGGETAGTAAAAAGQGESAGGEARTATGGVEVTIRISKRQLRELMAKAAGGGGGVTVEKVLAEIVDAGEVVGRRRRRWVPALHSISEAVES
ncbi:hypothetical protein ACP4OV_030875 [Aristida adscensionis]